MKLRSLLALGCALTSSAALADNWSFANVSLNYLDWSKGTEQRTNDGAFGGKKDFGYVEFEGGMGGNWGEVYGFADIENPGNNKHENDIRTARRTAAKAVGRYNLTSIGATPVQLYAHVYDFRDGEDNSGRVFFDQNRVLGLGTSLSFGKLWVKPFIGFHQELKQDVGAHMNGYMAGWVLGYNFEAFGQPFMVTQWHETEFKRKDEYLTMGAPGKQVAKGDTTAWNGAVSLWWTPTKQFTAGIQYRYADQKLGSVSYQNAIIYTTKYNF